MVFGVTVEPDPERGRGHARLVLRGAPPESFAPMLLIRRPGSGANHLAPGGWQAAEHFWQPDSVAATPDGAVLGLGPDIVCHMENGTYRFGIVEAPGRPAEDATVVWRDIPGPLDVEADPTVIRRRRGGVSIGQRPAPETAREAADAAAAEAAARAAREAAEAEARRAAEAQRAKQREDDAVAPPRPGRPAWLWAVLAVLLLAGAGGAYLLLKPDGGDHKGTAAHDSGAKDKAAADRPALDQARQALRDPNLSAAAAVALARKLTPRPNGADAAFLLWDYAAGLGDGAAALELGGYYDPARPAAGSIAKNGAQAVKWYGKAKAGGVAEAAARLDALRAWAADPANAAGPEAGRTKAALDSATGEGAAP